MDIGQGPSHELGADVLHAHGAFPDTGDTPGVAAAEQRRVRCQRSRLRAVGQHRAQITQARQGHQVQDGGGVVCLQHVRDLLRGAAMGHQGLAQCSDDPLRVGVADRLGGLPESSGATLANHCSRSWTATLRSTALTSPDGPAPIWSRTSPTVESSAAWAFTRIPSN